MSGHPSRAAAPPPGSSNWVLRKGTAWVLVRPTGRRIAEVAGGTLFAPGDGVERPAGMTWDEARTQAPNGDTRLDPFELRKVFDGREQAFCVPTAGAAPSTAADAERAELARYLSAMLRGREADPLSPPPTALDYPAHGKDRHERPRRLDLPGPDRRNAG